MIILLGGDSVWSFFSVSASVCDSRNWNPRSNSFIRAPSWGVAQTFALPYPFRIWPGSGAWAERDKREVRIFLYFGGYTPELFLDLGIYMQRLNEKNIPGMGKPLFPCWHHFQIGFLFRPHHTFFMVTPRSVWHIVVRLLCRCFSISDFTVKYLCSSVRCLRGGPFPAQRHHYTQCYVVTDCETE